MSKSYKSFSFLFGALTKRIQNTKFVKNSKVKAKGGFEWKKIQS